MFGNSLVVGFWWVVGWLHPLMWRRSRLVGRDGQRVKPMVIGAMGERMAVMALRRMGRKVIYRNYRGPKGGEVDVVVRDGEVLCFVEVKTRRRREGSRPLDAVTVEKQELIERGARSWLGLLKDNDFQWRFDVVEVTLEEGERPEVHVVDDYF